MFLTITKANFEPVFLFVTSYRTLSTFCPVKAKVSRQPSRRYSAVVVSWIVSVYYRQGKFKSPRNKESDIVSLGYYDEIRFKTAS